MRHSKKIAVAAAALLAAAFLSARANEARPFEKEIAAFEAATQANAPAPGAVVFTGSSTIRKWTSLAADFPKHHVLNRGFGGSRISDVNYYFDRILPPCHPGMVVLYAGSNDINGGKSVDTVVNDFTEFLHRMDAELPGVPVAYISINTSPSRWKDVDKVREANRRIAALLAARPHSHFIDTFPTMLDEAGKPKPEFYLADRLHPSAAGYAVMKKVIEPFLPAE